MDILQDYAVQAYQLYNTIDPYLQPVRDLFYQARAELYPILVPLLHKAAIFTQESPAIISIGALFLLLLIAMRVLSFVRRVMLWWTRLVMGLFFWAAVGLLVMVVAQRGLARTVGDLAAWGAELADVWSSEYRRWEGYQNQAIKPGRSAPRAGVRGGSSWR